jgi:hypothetical protein
MMKKKKKKKKKKEDLYWQQIEFHVCPRLSCGQ